MRFSEKLGIAFAILVSLNAGFAADIEEDILEHALKNPLLNRTYDGKTVKYGNPALIEAEKELCDIPRPWTVHKMVRIYLREKAIWMAKLKERIRDNNPEMWPNALIEAERIAHLATVLGASCDPRAALALESGIAEEGLIGGMSAIEAIHTYFLDDPRYKRPPIEGPFGGNGGPAMIRDVKRWLRLNRAQIRAEVQALIRRDRTLGVGQQK